MTPAGAPPGDRPRAWVVRGRAATPLATAVRELVPASIGPAVVLARLAQPTPVAAAVVETVVETLLELGCSSVTVGDRLSSEQRDRGARSVSALAAAAGLRGRTPRGAAYEVADLLDETVTAPVPPAAVLHGRAVSARWVAADVRVVLGRAVTDLYAAYAGCLDTLLGAAEEVAGAEPADVVAELVEHAGPHLAVVDALAVSSGPDGARLPRPSTTDALVVAADPLLADTTLATLLGEDRSASPLVRSVLARRGAPTGIAEGDLSLLAGVRRVHPLLRRSAAAAAADPRVARVLRAATGPAAASAAGSAAGAADPNPSGPSGDRALAGLRAVLAPILRAADEPVGLAAACALLDAVGAVSSAGRAWTATLDKRRALRPEVPLGFDPAARPAADYDGLPAYLAPFEELVEALPPVPDGLRWCLVDGATVFEVSRTIAAPFDDFVARVDVAAGISLMADYLGGRRVAVELSPPPPAGTSRQAERNLYLPQPNYLAAWGGPPIDVCKVELVQRSADAHRLRWRTVASPNGSAAFDDGSLVFERDPAGTRVTVRGRQLFSLPASWSGVDLEAVPEVRTPLLEDAYRRFFTTTFDNLEACYEGREFRVGRPPPDSADPLPTAVLGALVAQVLAGLGAAGDGARREPTADEVDHLGFRHVRGTRGTSGRTGTRDTERTRGAG